MLALCVLVCMCSLCVCAVCALAMLCRACVLRCARPLPAPAATSVAGVCKVRACRNARCVLALMCACACACACALVRVYCIPPGSTPRVGAAVPNSCSTCTRRGSSLTACARHGTLHRLPCDVFMCASERACIALRTARQHTEDGPAICCVLTGGRVTMLTGRVRVHVPVRMCEGESKRVHALCAHGPVRPSAPPRRARAWRGAVPATCMFVLMRACLCARAFISVHLCCVWPVTAAEYVVYTACPRVRRVAMLALCVLVCSLCVHRASPALAAVAVLGALQ